MKFYTFKINELKIFLREVQVTFFILMTLTVSITLFNSDFIRIKLKRILSMSRLDFDEKPFSKLNE